MNVVMRRTGRLVGVRLIDKYMGRRMRYIKVKMARTDYSLFIQWPRFRVGYLLAFRAQ